MPRVTELYAYIAEDNGPEDEGIMAMSMTVGERPFMMPLVGADKDRMLSLMPAAEFIAKIGGKPYKLKRFVLVESN